MSSRLDILKNLLADETSNRDNLIILTQTAIVTPADTKLVEAAARLLAESENNILVYQREVDIEQANFDANVDVKDLKDAENAKIDTWRGDNPVDYDTLKEALGEEKIKNIKLDDLVILSDVQKSGVLDAFTSEQKKRLLADIANNDAEKLKEDAKK